MKRLVVIFSILMFGAPALAQDIHLNYIWKLSGEVDLSKKEQKVSDQLGLMRFRIRKKNDSSTILHTLNINGFKRFLKSKKDTLYMNSQAISSAQLLDSLHAQFKQRYPTRKFNRFRRYMRRVRKADQYTSEIWEFEFDVPPSDNIQLTFQGANNTIAKASFRYISGNLAFMLPQVDRSQCRPMDRVTFFQDMMPPIPDLIFRNYRPRSINRYVKTFTLYFAKNESDMSEQKIAHVVRYLLDSNLVIDKATIEAFASVEGDLENNLQLQHARAEVLVEILQKVNKELIASDIQTAENWELFRKQISDDLLPLDSLENIEIKEQLYDEATQQRYEPYLARQRVAQLHLTLSRRLTKQEKLGILYEDDAKNFTRYYRDSRKPARRIIYNPYTLPYLKKFLAIRDYARKMVRRGYYSLEDFEGLSKGGRDLFMANYHQVMKEKAKGKTAVFDSYTGYHQKALKVTRGAMPGDKFQWTNPFFVHAGKVQENIFEGLKTGELDPAILKDVYYPDAPGFYHLIMNKMDFLNNEGSKFKEVLEEKEKDTTLYERWWENPAMNSYYFFLKKMIVNDDPEISKLVASRTDRMMHWDLFEFLWFNINGWDPTRSSLYDSEVSPDMAGAYLRKLWSMNTNICPDDLYSLRLQYELKRLKAAFKNQRMNKRDQDAYLFIHNYYKSRRSITPAHIAVAVGKTMVALNFFEFYNGKAKDAYRYLTYFYEAGLLDDLGAAYYEELKEKLGYQVAVRHQKIDF